MRKFIICIVDPKDNTYDYELDGLWTDSLEVAQVWINAGIEQFVLLDALSLELVSSFDHDDLQEYINGILGE